MTKSLKLNIANPATGLQIILEIEDEKRIAPFYDKRMSQELEVDFLGEEWAGYVLRITGGNDKQGFPMKQGVLVPFRVRLLMGKGHSCYRPRRRGERKRKSVRGCIVGPDLSILNLVVVKKGLQDVPGLTDSILPLRRGPKRASKIRKLYNLNKEEDVRKFVIRRELPNGRSRAPKIQRLVTPLTLQRKRKIVAMKKARRIKNERAMEWYGKLVHKRRREEKIRKEALAKKRAQRLLAKRQTKVIT